MAREFERLPGNALSLILFWLGGSALLVSLVIGIQMLAVTKQFGPTGQMLWLVPIWAVGALVLAFLLRGRLSAAVRAVSVFWLLAGVIAALLALYVCVRSSS